MSVVDFHI